jgi:ParB family chromosome partitioning protein
MSNPMKKNPLGRGLESLIPRSNIPQAQTGEGEFKELDITDIVPNDFQPRRDFDTEALEALTKSVKSKGIIQPLVVMKRGNSYMLIAGERRLRAAGLAGLKKVPAVIIDEATDSEKLELALIENTQRDDLKPMELALAYKNLMEAYDCRQEDVARIAGKSRSAVANTMRLLDLSEPVMQALEMKLITEGHARVFLSLNEEQGTRLLNAILKNSLSVRQAEAMAKDLQNEGKPEKPKVLDADRQAVQKELEDFFGSKVRMKASGKKGGVIEIKYSSDEELDKIVNLVRGV